VAALVAVPDLGRGMVGGLVAEWYRPDGAEVEPGEAICRLECDFIAVDIEAERGGILRHRKPAGSIERKGAVLGVIVARGEPLPAEEELRAFEPTAAAADGAAERRVQAGDDAAPGGDGSAPPAAEPVPTVRHEPDAPASDGTVVPFPRRPEAAERAEPLPEPGGAIPGLPLWEEEDQRAAADADAEAPGPSDVRPGAEQPARFARIAREAAAQAEVLSAHVCVSWTRAAEAVEALADEWHPFGPRPRIEDLALRAIARALAEAGVEPGPAGMVIVEPESDRSFAVETPLDEEFRRMVQARADGQAPFERADWVVVSLLPLGVERLEPRLAGGRLAFGLGAGRDGSGTITMRYDSTMFGEGDAGRVLARVRSLVENPYRLWG
jgi:pyruvate/2-oxoglutarate dehydrogenase complex dihydrolipoamide acyltransferase (E2) component